MIYEINIGVMVFWYQVLVKKVLKSYRVTRPMKSNLSKIQSRESKNTNPQFSTFDYFKRLQSWEKMPSISRTGQSSPPFVCKFNSTSTKAAFCNEDGLLYISNFTQHIGIKVHDNAVFDFNWSFDDQWIVFLFD
jgi:hypothetical protein